MSFTSFRIFFASVTTAMAIVSICIGNASKKHIRSWVFFRTTYCEVMILFWNFTVAISRTQDDYRINAFMAMLFIVMCGLMGQQKYGGEEKNTNEISVKKDRAINRYAFVCIVLCVITSFLFTPL